jgi:hypothetical protein
MLFQLPLSSSTTFCVESVILRNPSHNTHVFPPVCCPPRGRFWMELSCCRARAKIPIWISNPRLDTHPIIFFHAYRILPWRRFWMELLCCCASVTIPIQISILDTHPITFFHLCMVCPWGRFRMELSCYHASVWGSLSKFQNFQKLFLPNQKILWRKNLGIFGNIPFVGMNFFQN